MGGGEVGKPLEIPWMEMFSDCGGRVPEVIVTPSASGATEVESGCMGEKLTDHELRETITRLKARTSDSSAVSRLPDMGEKLINRLRRLERELSRREEGARSCKIFVTESRATVSPGLQNHQPSFVSLFSKKLKDKDNSSLPTAFSQEIRSIKRTQKSKLGENAGMSLKSPSYRYSSDMDKGAKEISSIGQPKQCATSFTKYLTHFFKGQHSRDGAASLQNSTKDPSHSFDMDVVLLDEEDANDIKQTHTNSDELKEAKIYYPSRDHPECVEIRFLDLKCLDPNSYLSSTIMNFYIQYLQNQESIIDRSSGEYHFFNTYFYKKLEEATSFKFGRNVSFAKLRRWLKGVNIFQKLYLFLPIHGSLHWSLVIIYFPATDEECGPAILHLDSLGLHDSKMIFENIERYLKEEWNHVCQNSSSEFPTFERVWNSHPCGILKKRIMVPQQKNEYDCGLFVLYFMERFIEESPESLRIKDFDTLGKRLFRSEEASGLRKRIRDLLVKEFENARLEDNAGSQISSKNSSFAS